VGQEPARTRLELLIRARLAIRSGAESLAVIGGLALALLTGLLGCVLIAVVMAAMVSLPNSGDPPGVWRYVYAHYGVLVLGVGGLMFLIVFVGMPVTRGRYLAGLLHYTHRFQRPPPPLPPVPKYEVSAPKWARGPEHWWNRIGDAAQLAVAALLVLIGAAVLWFQLTVSRVQRLIAEYLGVGHIDRTLATIARPLVVLAGSVSLLFTVLFLVAMAVIVWEGVVNGLRRYRSYMRRTTQPPVD